MKPRGEDYHTPRKGKAILIFIHLNHLAWYFFVRYHDFRIVGMEYLCSRVMESTDFNHDGENGFLYRMFTGSYEPILINDFFLSYF